MGYELHITKRGNWFDEDESKKISIYEWKEYVNIDPELRLDNFTEAKLPNGDVMRYENEGLSVWIEYSGENIVWFDYYKGIISAKSPDEETIKKMLRIAEYFNAKVQGDDGEIYEISPQGNIVNSNMINDKTELKKNQKPWWKLW
jgi:hypothetical protein